MIINLTKNQILAQTVYIADTPIKRMKGLIGFKSLKTSEAMLIKPCNSIHTFFMRFPIDLLFIDKDNIIIKAMSDIKPYRFSPLYLFSRAVIELSSGTIRNTGTKEGDQISID